MLCRLTPVEWKTQRASLQLKHARRLEEYAKAATNEKRLFLHQNLAVLLLIHFWSKHDAALWKSSTE